jgi:hypothetical protein
MAPLAKKIIIKLNRDFVLSRFWSEILAKHIDMNTWFNNWWANPFNGQSQRLFVVSGLALRFKPTIAVETGTFVGSSTWILCGMNVSKTYSIEANPKFAKIAKIRHQELIKSNRLEILIGDSREKLQYILNKISKQERILAYLDAHWHGDIPTIKEVALLVEWGGAFIGVIDDFKVPDDKGYGFDSYSGIDVGQELFIGIKGLHLFVPSTPSELETGFKRGTGYIFNQQALNYFNMEYILALGLKEIIRKQ